MFPPLRYTDHVLAQFKHFCRTGRFRAAYRFVEPVFCEETQKRILDVAQTIRERYPPAEHLQVDTRPPTRRRFPRAFQEMSETDLQELIRRLRYETWKDVQSLDAIIKLAQDRIRSSEMHDDKFKSI